MNTLTYIGIGIAPYACSVITTIASQDNPGEYVVTRVWNNNSVTYKGIIQEIRESLKTREITSEGIEILKAKAMEHYGISEIEMTKISKNALINHHYSIVGFKDAFLEKEIEKIDYKYRSPNQYLNSPKYSEPKSALPNMISLTSALINDDMVSYDETLNIEGIKREINSLTEPERFNNLSPQLTALTLSLGEAEYRRVNNEEDLSVNLGDYSRGLIKTFTNMQYTL